MKTYEIVLLVGKPSLFIINSNLIWFAVNVSKMETHLKWAHPNSNSSDKKEYTGLKLCRAK